MLKESFGKRKVFFHLISVLNRHFCGGRSLVFWQKVHCCCKSSQCLPAAIDLCSCRGNIGFMFSVYIACLILGFSDGTEHCYCCGCFTMSTGLRFNKYVKVLGLDLVMMTRISLDIVAGQWFSLQFSFFKIQFKDFHLLSGL